MVDETYISTKCRYCDNVGNRFYNDRYYVCDQCKELLKDWTVLRNEYESKIAELENKLRKVSQDFNKRWKKFFLFGMEIEGKKLFYRPEIEGAYDDTWVSPLTLEQLEKLVKKMKSFPMKEYKDDERLAKLEKGELDEQIKILKEPGFPTFEMFVKMKKWARTKSNG